MNGIIGIQAKHINPATARVTLVDKHYRKVYWSVVIYISINWFGHKGDPCGSGGETIKMKVKAVILLILLSMIFIACNERGNNNKHADSKDKKREKQWRERFKDLVLCNCVVMGISDSSVRMKFLMTDKSFYDPMNFVMEHDIKQLLTPVIADMKQDSVNSLTTLGEGAQGISIFDNCLKFYKSKKLDTIADQKLFKWNHTDIDSVMSVVAPAY
ncbi:hypothetical protein ACFQ3S_05010 [Mucilaginibacter terrae]|uniref:hypothetical protein n=1 Tax=Mucilaginibacter terrae TaxID=1955052 RepID=UPI003633CDD5